MRARPVHSCRSAILAVLLTIGILGILAAHLDADPVESASVRVGRYANDASARARHANYLAIRRGTVFGIPPGAYENAVTSMQEMECRRGMASIVPLASPGWTALGPLPVTNEVPIFGTDPIGGPLASATGKVTAIAADPTTAGRLFIGTSGGGVWMSTNGGTSFAPIFDAQPTLAIGAIALDPTTNPPTIYVGTGEANNTVDSYFGLGMFISTDLGNTWTRNTGLGAFTNLSFSRIAIDTSRTPRVIFAALSTGSSSNRAGNNFINSNIVNNGLWKSPDAGATWTQVPFTSQLACPSFGGFCPAEDVAIDPFFPANVFVAIYQFGVFASNNGGSSWHALSFPGIDNTRIGRAGVATRNGIVYVMLGATDGIEYLGFFKSTNGGNSFTPMQVPVGNLPTSTIDGTDPSNFSAADYDQALAIDPSDAGGATVIFGGVGIYRSTDSGARWTFIGQNGGVHADQHALAMDPFNAGRFFAGNDGGVYSFNPAWAGLTGSFGATGETRSL